MYFPPVPDPDTDKSQGFANDENPGMQEFGVSLYFDTDRILSTSNIGASLKLGLGTQVKYIVPKEEEASLKHGLGTQVKYIVPKEEEASLKLGLGTQVKYIVPKDEEGSVEDHETKDEVIQASNVETKGIKLFGVQIA
ncbi:hypothetical protein Tco_0163210 [Tanacetum coccineum]